MSTTEDTTRRFHIGDVLSITTGRLVSPDHIDGVYRILGYMTGDPGVMTHQLPLASDAVGPDIRQQLPWTNQVVPPEKFTGKEHVEQWVAEQAARFGEWHELTPAPLSWGQHDPTADFTNQYPNTPVIAVQMPAEGGDAQ